MKKGEDVNRCAKYVWDHWGSAQCSRRGVLQETDVKGDEKLKIWCKQHAPSSQLARDKAWRAKFDADRERESRRYSRRAAEYQLMQLVVKIPTDQLPKELLIPINSWLNNGGLDK